MQEAADLARLSFKKETLFGLFVFFFLFYSSLLPALFYQLPLCVCRRHHDFHDFHFRLCCDSLSFVFLKECTFIVNCLPSQLRASSVGHRF